MKTHIHADDLGASPNINKSIMNLFMDGAIDGASVLANGDDLETIANGIRNGAEVISKKIILRVHLNLSEGKPITDPEHVTLLVNADGMFMHGFCGLAKLWFFADTQAKLKIEGMVRKEFNAQVHKVLTLFGRDHVVGVDGHMHIHMIPFIFRTAVDVCREHGLNEMRLTKEYFHLSLREARSARLLINAGKHLLLNFLAHRNAKKLRQARIFSTDSVAGILYSGLMTLDVAQAAVKRARRKGDKEIELIFHPGHATSDEGSRWKYCQEHIGKFYLDNQRIMERQYLKKIGRYRFNDLR